MLEPGQLLSHFRIEAKLGDGGMGEVFRATDTRLNRTVAIKVLRKQLASDPQRRARFEREARAVSSLNHRHICTLHDVGEHDGTQYLVMEHVEGETLQSRLDRDRLPLECSLEYAIQIADALDEAHRKKIVHRDLKPGNIMVTASGIKLLDFGLAKLRADSGQNISDASTTLTAEGTILGTLHYMAPEQLEGKEADHRTDVFAFGGIVYEMVTGKKAFEGDIQIMTPPMLDRVVRKCLSKNPDHRWQTARDLLDELTWIAESGLEDTAGIDARSRSSLGSRAILATVTLLVGIAGTAFVLRALDTAPPAEVSRLALDVEEGWFLRSGPDHVQRPSRQALVLSPDGRTLVYAAADSGERQQLFRRPLDLDRSTAIAGTEGGSSPFFSHDGRSVGFFVGDQLMRVELEGGERRPISVSGTSFTASGASWTPRDTILLTSPEGLIEVSADGGASTPLTRIDRDRHEWAHLYPEMLPKGRSVLFNVARGRVSSSWDIVAVSVDSGERHLLVEGGSDPRYVESGHILFARRGTLMAVPFDVDGLEVTGNPVVVVEGIMHTAGGWNDNLRRGDVQFSVSRTGSLAYAVGGIHPIDLYTPAWFNRDGEIDALRIELHRNLAPRLSPDGTKLAYERGRNGERQIWVYDIDLELPARLTSRGDHGAPVWSPDGSRIAFNWDGGIGAPANLFWMAADGSGEPERLTEDAGIQVPSSWSRDGELAYVQSTAAGRDLMVLRIGEGVEPEPFLQTPFDEIYPAFSPDGEWLAYSSDATGRYEVYVRPFPAGEPEYRISSDGGQSPAWSPDGRELFYRSVFGQFENETRFMVVDVTTEPAFQRSRPRTLFQKPLGGTIPTRSYDVAADGKRFVMLVVSEEPHEPQPVTSIKVVLNWFEELEERVPAPR